MCTELLLPKGGCVMEQREKYLIMVKRYLEFLRVLRPNLVPKKAEDCDNKARLSLEHALWMLHKMEEETYQPLTSAAAWISWIQACLYSHGLMNLTHEKDIMREIFGK